LAVVLLWTPGRGTSPAMVAVRLILSLLAAAGFVVLVRNLVDNSRISAVPDHLVPTSVVQAVLITALLLLGFAVVSIAPRWPAEHRVLRLLAAALLVALLLYIPLQAFETDSARTFIAETYAPLIIGEAGQLRTMIEDTLRTEFSR